MAEGGAPERQRLALVDETGPLARLDPADIGDGDAGGLARQRESFQPWPPARCRGSRSRRRRSARCPASPGPRRWPPAPRPTAARWQRRSAAATCETRHSLARSPGQPVRHIHRRRGMGAHRLGQCVAWLRQQIARHQVLALLGIQGPRGALAQGQPERGIADAAADKDAVAGLRAGAAHHRCPAARCRPWRRRRRRARWCARCRRRTAGNCTAPHRRAARRRNRRARRRRCPPAAPATAGSRAASRPWRPDPTGSRAAPSTRRCGRHPRGKNECRRPRRRSSAPDRSPAAG